MADQIQRDLSRLIRFEVDAPDVAWVTIQSVELSPDFSYARIYFTLLAGDPQAMQAVLNQAAGRLRRLLSRQMHTYRTPVLSFLFDVTVQRAAEMMRLIDQANATRAED